MRRTVLFCAVIALCPALALAAWLGNRVRADKPAPLSEKPATKKLPLSQVVLFNTGLGYFQREGEVEGDARIDLTIPASDINDLLKTVRIDNAGKPTSLTYEGTESVDNKLRSFGVDLTINPTLGQLLNQARGQKVELTMEGVAGGSTTAMSGTIVGMEAQFEGQPREAHHLNLLCSDGVRRVPLERVQRVRFLDQTLEDEFRRALSVLSAGQSDQRRMVSVSLRGEGKRKVKIGHVADTPIWKASYRLVLDDRKPTLQGWVIVENTTEEDWKDVRVVLVSGRPITFQMDLAQQLFMPRPTIEPEVFASLRPPTFAPATPAPGQRPRNQDERGGGAGQFGGQFGSQLGGQLGGIQLGGGMSRNNEGGGMAPASAFGHFNRYQFIPSTPGSSRLSYEELQRRRNEMLEQRKRAANDARKIGGNLADLGDGIDDVFTNADRIGEGFRYAVEPRVSLPRQKSGMFPTRDGDITARRLSIYTPSVHPRFPMQAVKLKNNTGQHLQQGPVAVFDGDDYVGDSRLPDMQPNQERLLTYAMDLGVEVRPEQTRWLEELTSIEIQEGMLVVGSRDYQKTVYQILNRSKTDRVVQVEHPLTDWKLSADSEKPAETTRQQYRFEWKVAAGKTEHKTLLETRAIRGTEPLLNVYNSTLTKLAESTKASGAVKAALKKVVEANRRYSALFTEETKVEFQLGDAVRERDDVTATIAKLPAGSAQHKRYLTRFDELDGQIAKLKALLKEKKETRTKGRDEYESMVRTMTVR